MNRLAKQLLACYALLTAVLPLARADRVCLINDAADAAQSRFDLANEAKRELNISYFYVGGEEDEFTMRGFALLRETARRGVKVRLMVDALFNNIPPHLGAHLVREGVEIRVFHPLDPLKPFRFNRRLHDKLFIADGHRLITGGRNIDDSYFGLSRFRKEGDMAYRNRIDRDILVEGDTAAEANAHFKTLWNGPKVKPMLIGKYRCLTRPATAPKRLTASRRRAIRRCIGRFFNATSTQLPPRLTGRGWSLSRIPKLCRCRAEPTGTSACNRWTKSVSCSIPGAVKPAAGTPGIILPRW